MPLLELEGLTVSFQSHVAVNDLDLIVDEGEIVALVGHNGAGKTTTLHAAYGLTSAQGGIIRIGGRDHTRREIRDRIHAGLSLVPQGNGIFRELSIQDNLELAGYTALDSRILQQRINETLELFPELAHRKRLAAGLLSGGQRQMVALAMGLISRPKCVLLDEPTLGLAPSVAERMMSWIRDTSQRQQYGVLIVEQELGHIIDVADRVYVLQMGEVVLSEKAADFKGRQDLWRYF